MDLEEPNSSAMSPGQGAAWRSARQRAEAQADAAASHVPAHDPKPRQGLRLQLRSPDPPEEVGSLAGPRGGVAVGAAAGGGPGGRRRLPRPRPRPQAPPGPPSSAPLSRPAGGGWLTRRAKGRRGGRRGSGRRPRRTPPPPTSPPTTPSPARASVFSSALQTRRRRLAHSPGQGAAWRSARQRAEAQADAAASHVPAHDPKPRQGLRLQLRSPDPPEEEDDEDNPFAFADSFKSPITPGAVTSALKPALPRPKPPRADDPASLDKEATQLCYGMDVSGLSLTDGNGNCEEDSSGVSSISTGDSLLRPTHRATQTFVPRHSDELSLSQGDPIHVSREAEDHWCLGTNLRSGAAGIFPSCVAFETVFDEAGEETYYGTHMNLKLEERDTFYVTYLGSLGVAHHKGNDVLVQSINKVLGMYAQKEELVVPKPVILDISFRGIHMIDKNNRNWFRSPSFDYFYSLQNISFCGSHPKQLRYFGFITKHPLLPRFAAHVFLSNVSTQPIVEALGRAFKKSYDEYMAFQHPTEDIYIE